MALATASGLALVIHTREAWDDTFGVLAGRRACRTGRCSTASPAGPGEARRALDLGASLSFSGIVTFKHGRRRPGGGRPLPARPAAGRDRFAVSGARAPPGPAQPPALVPVVGAGVAAARGVDTAVVEEASWANAERLFKLAL